GAPRELIDQKDEHQAHDHLHRARAADEEQAAIEEVGDEEDVDEVGADPPGVAHLEVGLDTLDDRVHAAALRAARSADPILAAWGDSRTSCARTAAAPAGGEAATQATLPPSRAWGGGALAPAAANRPTNDLREAPTRTGYSLA